MDQGNKTIKFILNGRFMAQPFSGVQRFTCEVLKEFARMKDVEVTVALPPDAAAPTVLSENINYITVGKHTGTRWEQFDLPRFCKRKKLPLLCTGNNAPVRCRSYVVLHDVLWLDMKKYAPKRSWSVKSKLMIRSFIYRSLKVFTVSEFSAERIHSLFPKCKELPTVVYNGIEHVSAWKEEEVGGLPQKFYLSVGSVYAHKNFAFVLRLAKKYPDLTFVIVGKKNVSYDAFLAENHIANCIFTGHMSDGQLAFLYRRCEGFILPSLYEGFGIPPLEAVACGCRKIFLSDIPIFHEVYGDSAAYFDPQGSDIPFSAPAMTEERAAALLSKYSWKTAAQTIVNAITE